MGENSVRVNIINHHASFVWGGKSVGGTLYSSHFVPSIYIEYYHSGVGMDS